MCLRSEYATLEFSVYDDSVKSPCWLSSDKITLALFLSLMDFYLDFLLFLALQPLLSNILLLNDDVLVDSCQCALRLLDALNHIHMVLRSSLFFLLVRAAVS